MISCACEWVDPKNHDAGIVMCGAHVIAARVFCFGTDDLGAIGAMTARMRASTPAGHPVQPLAKDRQGTLRFRRNAIVAFLADWASPRGIDMNTLALMPFDNEDRQQFAQLIGYSLSGYSELSYVDDDAWARAEALAPEEAKS